MTALALCMAAALQAAPQRPLVYQVDGVWLVLGSDGAMLREVRSFPPEIPTLVRDVAVSPDGNRLAVVAWKPEGMNDFLFLWDAARGFVRQIGEEKGFHAAPTFDETGQRLFFAHHPLKGGPPGLHAEGSFAQIYVQNLETLELSAVTSAPGCHMGSSQRGERLVFAHADCQGARRIEQLERGKTTLISEFQPGFLDGEPSLSSDGARVVFSRLAGDVVEIMEAIRGTRPRVRLLCRTSRVGERFRPQYLRSGDVMFQNGNELFIISKQGVARFNLEGM